MLTPLLLALGALAQSAPDTVHEGTERGRSVSYGVELAQKNVHADRGFILSDRPVVQPVIWLSSSVVSFWAWSSLPVATNTDGTLPQIVEMEMTHEREVGRFTIGPAVRMWIYHDPLSPYTSRSLEAWLYLSYDAGAFSLFTNHSVDVLNYAGAYFGSAGIKLERTLLETVESSISFSAGWASAAFNDLYVGFNQSAFNRVGVEGAFLAYGSSHVYVGPVFEFNVILDPELRAHLARPTYFLLGIATGIEF